MNPTIFLDDSDAEPDQFPSECLLCKRGINLGNFPTLITRALERKYCDNLNNYFYIRCVNRITNQERYSNQLLGNSPPQGVVQLPRRPFLPPDLPPKRLQTETAQPERLLRRATFPAINLPQKDNSAPRKTLLFQGKGVERRTYKTQYDGR